MNAKGGSRRLPPPIPAQRSHQQHRFGGGRRLGLDERQHAAYVEARTQLRELEEALDALAALEPRGELLAAACWLAVARLRRHHLELARPLLDEWLPGIAAA